MKKDKLNSISTSLGLKKKKKYQQYFNNETIPLLNIDKIAQTKRKSKSKSKTHRKQNLRSISPPTDRKNSKKKKNTSTNHQTHKRQKFSKLSKDFYSPDKDHIDMKAIITHSIKERGNTEKKYEHFINRAYEKLQSNLLNEASDILKEGLSISPQHYEMNYLLAVCFLIKNQIKQSSMIFQHLLRKKAKKNVYLLLAVCFNKQGQLHKAKILLDKCIVANPKYYQAYLYRAKLGLKNNQFQTAIHDFQITIRLKPQKVIGYIGKGDCLRLLTNYREAQSVYNQGLAIQRDNLQLIIRKVICELQLGELEAGLDDINQAIILDPTNSQAQFFKGLLFRKKGENNEAIIAFQQALKFNSHKKAVTKSLYELVKMQIQFKDYYEAVHTIQRSAHLDIDQKTIQKLQYFSNGMTSLMKKKYGEGLQNLNKLDQKDLNKFIRPLFYSGRAYAFMHQNKFTEAKRDLEILEKEHGLDVSNFYNKLICQGILSCNQFKYQQSLSFFSKAGKVISGRHQPYFYKAVCLISFASKLIPKTMAQKRLQYLENALKSIDKAGKISENNPTLYLIRGIVRHAIGKLQDAHKDYQASLSQSIKPRSINFYLSGLILGECGRYVQAIQQFKNAINYSDGSDLPEIELNKAKCLTLVGDINNAFLDLQSYMSARPSSSSIHIWAGHLLFHIGACQDAAKAYSNVGDISTNTEILLCKVKCYLSFRDVSSAIKILRSIIQLKPDERAQIDLEILEIYKMCAQAEQNICFQQALNKLQKCGSNFGENRKNFHIGYFFTISDYEFLLGLFYLYLGNTKQGVKHIKQSMASQQHYFQNNSKDCLPLIKKFSKLTYGNISFNYYEIVYNMAIAFIMDKEFNKADKLLINLKDRLVKQHDHQLVYENIQTLLSLIKKQRQGPVSQANSQLISITLNPFPVQNRLCSIFPQLLIQFSFGIIKTRLYFCLPYIEPPDIKPRFDDKILDDMQMNWIQVKPQAPWIRRRQQGVIFTSEIVNEDVQLSSDREGEQQKEQQQQQYKQLSEFDSDIKQQDGNHQRKMSPDELKKMLLLDAQTLQKLNKFIK